MVDITGQNYTDYNYSYGNDNSFGEGDFFSTILSSFFTGNANSQNASQGDKYMNNTKSDYPNIIDWTDKTQNFNDRIFFIVLHHTVTDTAEQAIKAFNSDDVSAHYLVDKDGSIYKVVENEKRAWHAGISSFDNRTNLNDTSIGIEIVNMGDNKFPDIQILKVADLTKMLMDEYNIKPHHVVSHADIAPDRKYDPSGYFDWKKFYARVGIFDDLFETHLTPKEQEVVLLDSKSKFEDKAAKLQKDLKTFGYDIEEDGIYGEQTSNVVQAFNRHFSPEIFIKEAIKDNKVIVDPVNQKWYKISEERLEFLLNQLK